MKIAVYNRYWRSVGGGERYCGYAAQCLAEEHEVDLLVHDPLDRSVLQERLDVDLARVGMRTIPDEDDVCFAYETSQYDLLINASYGSDAMCRARYGLYVCYFPVPHGPIKSGAAALAERLLKSRAEYPHVHIEWGDGWFNHERARDVYRWSTEAPTLRIWTPKGTVTQVRLIFLKLLPKGAEPTELKISIEGEVVRKVLIEPGRGSVSVDLPIPGKGLHPCVVELSCNTFRPHEQFGSSDPRHLGVPLVADQTGRPANGFTYRRGRHVVRPEMHFLESYDRIVSISRYTQSWVDRLWNKPSEVINPPVCLRRRGEKERIILSVGRFFDDASSHCKKQAEMVKAFRVLAERGLTGWTYHLAGGCEQKDLPYLARVKELAAGLPVEIHVGATGAELADLYARASIFWHATGLGEKENSYPERSEHFGITTVEAMSAGAVPVVIGKAGQLEMLEDGVHGRHFSKLPELVDRTWEIAHDDALRQRYSQAAEQHARSFGPEVFRRRIIRVVDEIADR